MNKFTIVIITTFLIFANTGLAKTKSVSDIDKEIAKLIKSADKESSKVTSLTEKYNEYFSNTNSLKEEGESLIELGKNGQIESLNNYKSYVKQMGQAKNSDDLHEEIKLLKKLQSSWEDFEKNIKKGENALSKSNKYNEKTIEAKKDLNDWTAKYNSSKKKIEKLREQKALLMNRK